MASAPKPLNVRVEKVRLGDLKLLELNARFMIHDQFHRLVANVKRDGALTSVPFAWKDRGGEYLVLSGNHRVQAAIEALGADHEAWVMLCDDPMPKDRRVALQLAHNAIEGQDDPAVLKELYESMESIDWRSYSGLDDKALELIEQVDVGTLNEANLDFQTVVITFLPTELDAVKEAFDAVREELGSGPDEVWVGSMKEYDRFLDALDAAGRSYDVRNVAATLGLVLSVFEDHREDLSNGYLTEYHEPRQGREKAWVPIETLLGRPDVPAAAAGTIRRALKMMRRHGDLSSDAGTWQALEYLCADYLAGLQANQEESQGGDEV